MKRLSAEQLKEMLDKKEDLYLINVLPRETYDEKHIPGSVNVPVQDDAFLTRMERIVSDKEAKIVVYCASESCDASPKAAAKLEDRGFKNLYDFGGGVKAWEESNLPLVGAAV
jgi:rhodanese-related sulfurtransferase